MKFASPDQHFLFADLSDFTALSEAHGDEPATNLLAEPVSAVKALVHSPRTAGRRTRTDQRGDSGVAVLTSAGQRRIPFRAVGAGFDR